MMQRKKCILAGCPHGGFRLDDGERRGREEERERKGDKDVKREKRRKRKGERERERGCGGGEEIHSQSPDGRRPSESS